MSYDCSDAVSDLAEMLASVGYTFHTDADDEADHVPGPLPDERWWFSWTDGVADIENGEDCEDELLAMMSALRHWTSNAKIATGAALDRPNLKRIDSLVESLMEVSFECGNWRRGESDETYETLYARRGQAQAELSAAIYALPGPV